MSISGCTSMRKRLPKKSTPAASAGSKKLKAKSLRKQMREIQEETNLAKRQSRSLVEKTKAIRGSAGKMYQAAGKAPPGTEKPHAVIRHFQKSSLGTSSADNVPQSFLVVGIGASAGGFEAFAQLLEQLPAETGMAFVFVQHLDPTHKSNLASLLSRLTQIKVTEIRNHTRLAPNQ